MFDDYAVIFQNRKVFKLQIIFLIFGPSKKKVQKGGLKI